MSEVARRYFVVPEGDRPVSSYANLEGAEAAAVAFGEGTWVVDTKAGAYTPALYQVFGTELGVSGEGRFDSRLGDAANLVEAAGRGSLPIVRAMLAKGVDPNAQAGGALALNWAVAKNDPAMAAALLAAGADPDRPDEDGTTARQLAEAKGRTALLAKG